VTPPQPGAAGSARGEEKESDAKEEESDGKEA
jgi:hypothetical protein